MNKRNSVLVQHLILHLLLSLAVSSQGAIIIPNPKLASMKDGFLELRPNGSLILRSTFNNSSSNMWQEALVFKAILSAIHLMPLHTKKETVNDLNEKIYGEGVEHKFPPFLERVIQRIQTYFSVYKYTDTSQPEREDSKPTTTMNTISAPADANVSAMDNDVYLSGDRYYGFNTTTSSRTSSRTEKSTVVHQAEEDEENEFIEIKDRKPLPIKMP